MVDYCDDHRIQIMYIKQPCLFMKSYKIMKIVLNKLDTNAEFHEKQFSYFQGKSIKMNTKIVNIYKKKFVIF